MEPVELLEPDERLDSCNTRYTFNTPAARPKKKPTNDSHGLVPSAPSSQNPAPKPRTIANTNDIPIVLSCPMSCHVLCDVGAIRR